ncbi:hypothetical protein BCV70DRAFT_197439 [Testicularia cyperi]|uniref:TPR-like protein n=1 Tax=Testicularia cyperi TaxID=1882483 RepID=A0A317XZ80_9BASI|nr:hypothetical protein BCV70DRAFT_197439 [Testicularia cyperi]
MSLSSRSLLSQGSRALARSGTRVSQPAMRTIASSSRISNQSRTTSNVSPPSGGSVGNVETPGFRPRPSEASSSSVRVGTLFMGLVTVAVAVTGYGLYEYYTSFSTWPPELRDDLRAAIKSRNRGDARRAESFFRKALVTARTIKPKLDEPSSISGVGAGEAMLKISGIAIALASLLEQEGQVTAAYDVLQDAWEELTLQGQYQPLSTSEKRTDRDRMRAVAVAQKLGQLGQLPEVRVEMLSTPTNDDAKDVAPGQAQQSTVKRASLTGTAESEDPSEKWLVWSVEELFRLILPADVREKALAAARAPENAAGQQTTAKPEAVDLNRADPSLAATPSEQISLADLDLPPWVSKLDILASIETLGTFYSMHKVPEFAVPLYLQALSILLPKTGTPTASERCKAGLVMNNLSQLLSHTNVDGATKWANKGLQIVESTVQKAGFENQPRTAGTGAVAASATATATATASSAVVESSDERTQEVKQECLGVKLTLLYNLGVLSDMANDKCQARTYFQKAYLLADKTGFTAAKTKAAESLARLERRHANSKPL